MRSLIRRIKKTYHMAEPHESKAVLDNVAFLSWLQVITYLLPMVILPYLFRVLEPEKFGLIAFAQAFVQYFMILADYGFNISATKEISLCHNEKVKINKVFGAVMTIKTALTFLSSLILGVVVYFVPKFNNDGMVYVLSFGAVVGNALFPVWFFQGTEKMKYIANLNIIGQIIYAISIFSFVKGPQDYLMVPVINSVVFLTTGLWGQYIVLKEFGVSFQWPGYKDTQRQLKAGWNIFISNVAINAYTTTRVFAVGLLTNNTMTGFYSIAERIANVVQTFPLSSFSQAIFPRLSKIFHRNKTGALEIMQHIQHITINISLICLPLIFIFTPFIVRVVCGGNYPPTVLSLRFLLISVFFISANAFRVQFLLVCGKTDIYSRIHITMAIIGLPLIIILISYFSYVGAAIATAVIEAGVFTITYFTLKKLTF
ncbi:MAG: flippase [Candidatus Omnitrophica bacterium]|nr:flippase [Candidatus Omnitrophota bacterium]